VEAKDGAKAMMEGLTSSVSSLCGTSAVCVFVGQEEEEEEENSSRPHEGLCAEAKESALWEAKDSTL